MKYIVSILHCLLAIQFGVCVVIIPNDITLSRNLTDSYEFESLEEAVSRLVSIDAKYLQYVEGEERGELLKSTMNPLVQAAHVAYSEHLPLVLTPDVIWYCISNAVAVYINKHSEEMRRKFVNHEGKKRITVRRDNFVFGTKNPWNEVIDEFSEKIKESTKENIVDRLQANFTTTSKTARVASQIVVMDAMQKYFDYHFLTMCGIPEVRIEGKREDWEGIKQRANGLVEIIPEFKQWIDQMNEIFDHFINSFSGKIDKKFWNQIYKVDGGSGGPYVTGWLISLFPYLNDGAENRYVWDKGTTWRNVTHDRSPFDGLNTNDFEYHMNQVPFKWSYFSDEFDMLFVGGLIGVNVNKDDFSLKPIFGYSVMEDKKNPQNDPSLDSDFE